MITPRPKRSGLKVTVNGTVGYAGIDPLNDLTHPKGTPGLLKTIPVEEVPATIEKWFSMGRTITAIRATQ